MLVSAKYKVSISHSSAAEKEEGGRVNSKATGICAMAICRETKKKKHTLEWI